MIDIAPIVWNHIARKYPEASEVSVDALEASLLTEGNRYTRNYHLIPLMQTWDAAGFGKFVVGRRKSPTRITFPRKVRQMEAPPSSTPTSSVEPPQLPILDLPLPLRPGVVARIQVPADLTQQECDRICSFLRMIPVAAASPTQAA